MYNVEIAKSVLEPCARYQNLPIGLDAFLVTIRTTE